MTAAVRHVAIVGAGITGLTAAFRLQESARRGGFNLETTVFEAENHPGGKIQTRHHDQFLLENGPDSFYALDARLMGIVRALGLETQLVPMAPNPTYVCARDGLAAIPPGMILGVPTRVMPFLRSVLFSPLGKLRVMLELLRGQSTGRADESVDEFFRRAFGRELVTRLIAPLFSAIYAEDVRHLSARVAVPRLLAIQAQHRSLILGLRHEHAGIRSIQNPQQAARKTAPLATFFTGMQALTDALAARQPACALSCGTAIRRIQQAKGRLQLISQAGKTFEADAVILATPSPVAARLLDLALDFAPLHARAPVSVASVTLGLPKSALGQATRGTGFIATRPAARHITACTWTHLKWPHCAPRGQALLRCHLGGPGRDEIVAADDGTILQAVLGDLARTMALHVRPSFYAITRWQHAMPRYAVGHLQRVARVREAVGRRLPGVQIAGASYGGPGLSTCVSDGEQAAAAVLGHLFGTAAAAAIEPRPAIRREDAVPQAPHARPESATPA